MATTEKKPGKLIIGPVRLTFVSVWQKAPGVDGGKPKYQTQCLIGKKDKDKIKQVTRAVNEAIEVGKADKWKGKVPRKADLDEILRDGDEKDWNGYAGHFYLSAKSDAKPGIVYNDKEKTPITDEEEIYSGVWAYLSLNIYPHDVQGGGLAVGLNNIMKVKDGEKFAGGSSAEEDFSNVEVNFDDEDEEDAKPAIKKGKLF